MARLPFRMIPLFLKTNITYSRALSIFSKNRKLSNYSYNYSTEGKTATSSHKIETQFGFEQVDPEKKQEKGS